MSVRAIRMDLSRFDGVEPSPGGGLRIPAVVTRVGVLEYEDAEGNRWGELRPEEEVFAEDSLATLRGAPLTDLHPAYLVTPETWKRVAIGHVGDDVRRDGNFVVASVIVQDGLAVERVQAGERREVSCGYECDLDETPGEHDGVAYQRIQRKIRYNHIGLGPEGWGRAGADVSLRLDGADTPARSTRLDAPRAHITTVTGSARRAAPASTQESHMANATKQRRDGDEPPAPEKKDPPPKADAEGAEEMKADTMSVEEHQKALAAMQAKYEALESALSSAVRELSELKALHAKEEQAEVAEEDVPEAVVDALVEKRMALRSKAALVLGGDVKLDGLKASEIQRKVIAHGMPSLRLDGLDAKALATVFDGIVAGAESAAQKRADGARQIAGVLAPTAAQSDAVREDGAAKDHSKGLQQRLEEAGRKPLNGKA